MKNIILSTVFLSLINVVLAHSFAINTDGSTADAIALFDVKSNSKAVLIPRMNKIQKNAIAATVSGLIVFQNALQLKSINKNT